MDQFEEFIHRFVAWTAETGAVGDPDLGLLRDLLECRAEVLEPEFRRDDWKIPPCFVWPNGYLRRTVLEVAPFMFPVDADVRAALIRTVPLLAGFIEWRCTKEPDSTVQQEAKELLPVLRDTELLATPAAWARKLRIDERCGGVRRDVPVRVPDGDRSLYEGAFEALSWERRDELAGPLSRPAIQLPAKFWETPPTTPFLRLPSTLAPAARQAPFATAVIEVAEFLADRPKVWTGSRLADDVVAQVLDGTTLDDPELVQGAWRLAALVGFLWPTPLRAFRGEKLDLWADPAHVVTLWTEIAEQLVLDLPDPLRDDVVRLLLAAFHPGVDDESAEVTAVHATPEGQTAVRRLRELGVLDGFGWTPLARQELLLRWTRWKAGEMYVDGGAWRPDLTPQDLECWLTALSCGRLDDAGGSWVQTAEPQTLAGQLVDVMLTTELPCARATAGNVLTQLGSGVASVVARLNGTKLQAYLVTWPDLRAPAPDLDALLLWIEDFQAFQVAAASVLDRLRPGGRIDLSRLALPAGADETLARMAVPGGHVLTAEDIEQLKARHAAEADEFEKLRAELLAERSDR